MFRDPRVRRGALAFGFGAAWIALAGWVSQALIGDEGVDWIEVAVRAVLGGIAALAVASVVLPRRLNELAPAVGRAMSDERLPAGIDPGPWRATLRHHRGALWVWRWLFPVVCATFALVGAVWAFVEDGGARGALAGLAIAFAAGAAGLRAWADRRRVVLEKLLSELDERDVRAG
jgi:hypothetical protein